MMAINGNQITWRYGLGPLPVTAAQVAVTGSQAEVIAAKPAAAVDLCVLTGDTSVSTPAEDAPAVSSDAQWARLEAVLPGGMPLPPAPVSDR